LLLLGGALAAAAVAGAAYRRRVASRDAAGVGDAEDERLPLGWGADVSRPEPLIVETPDGAELAVWDLAGEGPDAPVVVLPHCWGCSHEIWLPVARRLRDQGYRVVLYDQRGHGGSTRGTAPLAIETLAEDLACVLEARDVSNAVLAGHSMGGMTIMSLAAHRPEVMKERVRAAVLVATSARDPRGESFPQAARVASTFIASPIVTRAMRSANGHRFVRGAFGADPVHSHILLTRDLFAGCDPSVRGGWLAAMTSMNLLEGIASMEVPTTVMVGSRDTLTVPARAQVIASTVPGARLITLEGRGHMLPLEDPDAVTDEIVRAVKG
jgi:pimeloyl-ACP methyl ester carboxylesterase